MRNVTPCDTVNTLPTPRLGCIPSSHPIMISASARNHIPAGCIFISKDESNLSPDDWERPELREWAWLLAHDNPVDALDKDVDSSKAVRTDLWAKLLRAVHLAPCARLLRASWISIEFKVIASDTSRGVARVYLLPDDIDRRRVDRMNAPLRKARRQLLLQQLDYSRKAWNDSEQSSHAGCRLPFQQPEQLDGDNTTLLQLFNDIPPPEPDPDSVRDSYAQDAMVDLLDSRVTGLTTSLYQYQRRSAALMFQKEVQPGTVLDPRLLHLQDQAGSSWYMDPVIGTVRRDPHYYDGISGGILAEEMGTGKTIICLALILATKHLPTQAPEIVGVADPPRRSPVAALADMAASCATRNGIPWKSYLEHYGQQLGYEFSRCAAALERNPGFYLEPAPEPRRGGRHPILDVEPPKKIYLSAGSLVVVPTNLVTQWKQEIKKHTEGLKTLTLVKDDAIPSVESLLQYDIILFSQSRFEKAANENFGLEGSRLTQIHFKRCIVDEGHKLGNSKMGNKSVLLMGLDAMRFNSRWIVTGTPSHGLFGVENDQNASMKAEGDDQTSDVQDIQASSESSAQMEKKDLERIGAIAALYLKARPWANTLLETGDTVADWATYMMLPKHNPKGQGRWDSLRATLNSLIVRHGLSEVGDLLPPVHEKTVVLDGSFQDRLSQNLFSMMIISNAVQSQRTDQDYFFHPKQRKQVLQIVSNMKQSSFFGGSFFTREEIITAVKTAEQFLEERKISISDQDETLLRDAIDLGRLATENKLRNLSNQFHEMPLNVQDLPGGAGASWSLSGEAESGVSTSASMILALQKLVFSTAGAPEGLNALLNGGLVQEGINERHRILTAQTPSRVTVPTQARSQTLAGNTKLGEDSPRKSRSHGINGVKPKKAVDAHAFKGPLELTKITATVSAKLSYLIDSIVKYQEDEKIIIFYENENVAWYLASTLDVVRCIAPLARRDVG